MAHSQSAFLNPDRNPLLRAIVKPIIYDQFCAGVTKSEIQSTVSRIKGTGFSGVLLAYGKEIEVNNPRDMSSMTQFEKSEAFDKDVDTWLQGNLQTLDMIGDRDFLAVKFSGAGKAVCSALAGNADPPKQFTKAVDKISEAALSRGCRVIIDAEQQVLQAGIDRWTIDLMRRYNRYGKPLIYNTLQAYLKDSRAKLQQQLKLAQSEGWSLAIKLVRGAYISNDFRERIHDTKTETDDSYNTIVSDLLTGSVPGFEKTSFPTMSLFLAGHNPHSVEAASKLVRRLMHEGELKTLPEFGQLQGMADELGCNLLRCSDDLKDEFRDPSGPVEVPRVYKYLTWGSVQECLQYLIRRAVENQGATERMRDGMSAMSSELWRRARKAVLL